eukprot:s292_g9.t2
MDILKSRGWSSFLHERAKTNPNQIEVPLLCPDQTALKDPHGASGYFTVTDLAVCQPVRCVSSSSCALKNLEPEQVVNWVNSVLKRPCCRANPRDMDAPGTFEPGRLSFWELHEKLGQCYKALWWECASLKRKSTCELDVLEEEPPEVPEAKSSEEEHSSISEAAGRFEWLFDEKPSPPPGMSPPSSPGVPRSNRKKVSPPPFDGTPEDGPGRFSTWGSRAASHGQGLSLAQLLSGPRQMSLSRQISAPQGGRQLSVDFNERVLSTDIGQHMPGSLGAAAELAERAKGSTSVRQFLEDRYQEDRKVAFENMSKLEKVVSRKSVTMPSVKLDASHASNVSHASLNTEESSKFGSEVGENLFQTRQCFNVMAFTSRASQRKISADAGLRTRGSKILELSLTTQKSMLGCDGGKLVMTPGGITRAIWDALRMICVIIDIVVIPLRFFEIPVDFDWKVKVFSFFSLIFWTLDILVSFRTGHFEKGVLVMDSRKIAKHYLKRWFLFDLCVIVLDYILLGMDGFGSLNTLPDSTQVLQVIRMIRVGRLLKWNQMFASLRERFDSQYWITQMSIVNIIIQILLMYHVVACIFFGLGKLNESQVSWIQTYDLKNAEFGYQYTTTLHWALCQLGMGSNIIEATNLVERLFGIVVVLFAIITFSSLVSLMTSLLTTLHNAGEEELHQFRLLRSFLVRNQIPGGLSQRVKNFLQHSYTMQREVISETQVPLLSLLSKNLQGELQFARYQRSLNFLAFVADALLAGDNLQHREVAHEIAANAVTQTFLATSEVVFYAGNVAEHVFLATSGALLYLQNRGKTVADLDTWISEMSLWTPWSFCGDLLTQDLTVLVMVEQSSFCDIVCKSPETQQMAKIFAEDYVANMNAYTVASDLWQYPGDEDHQEEGGRQWMTNLFGKNQKRRSSVRRASDPRLFLPAEAQDVVPGANGLPGLDSQNLQVLQRAAQNA